MKSFDVDLFGDREFFEIALDHLCVAGFDGYWKRLNPSWTRTLGFSAEELMACPLIEFVHPEDREATLAARGRLKEGEPLRALVNRYRCKDGSYRWFEWRSVSNVERQLVYAIARDVTAEQEAQRELQRTREAQERMERQLLLADRMASVGMLAAGVAHEINNPLTYVLANLDIIVEDLERIAGGAPLTRLAECTEMAREAREGAERIRNIVRGLKTFSRADAERRSVIDVTAVLDLSIQMTSNEIRHRARLVKDYGPMPLVEADDGRLGQVFINLLVNAAQAIGDGPERKEIRIVTGTDYAGRAVIEIRDTGPGIPANVIDKIFDPFFTTKPIGIGTGLGLSICHNIVTALGGRITASNGASGGAVFRVTLPAAARPIPEPPRAVTLEPVATRRAALLVIDDERSVGESLRRRLDDHDVTAVTSAREALDLLAAGARFDMILSDLMMPEMSGMQLYDELARVHPDLVERVVFMTGGAFTDEAHAFLDRVSNECLAKPFSAAELRTAIQRFVS